jgi:hypothetical protein
MATGIARPAMVRCETCEHEQEILLKDPGTRSIWIGQFVIYYCEECKGAVKGAIVNLSLAWKDERWRLG